MIEDMFMREVCRDIDRSIVDFMEECVNGDMSIEELMERMNDKDRMSRAEREQKVVNALNGVFRVIEKKKKAELDTIEKLPKSAIISMIRGVGCPPFNAMQFFELYDMGHFIGGMDYRWQWTLRDSEERDARWLAMMYELAEHDKFSKDLEFNIGEL